VFALTLGESAFLSEIFRAGLEAIPRSQWEAATSLGFAGARRSAS
jgi:polar amino acid transport system permease protein